MDNLTKIAGMTSICLNFNPENTNVILGKKTSTLWGEDAIEDTIGGIRYRISPQSFYQVNPVQTEKLYRTALEFADIKPGETVWDLYCGIGTISLFIAKELGGAGEVIGCTNCLPACRHRKCSSMGFCRKRILHRVIAGVF